MATESPKTEIEAEPESVFSAVDSVNQQLQAIETFVARRFDEISMEINATAQQMDMNEEDIQRKFSEIFSVVKDISFSGEGSTAANTGVELDAVIKITNDAANTILDQCDQINGLLDNDDEAWANPDSRKFALQKIGNHVTEIVMACSFQDLTGQRINKTLEGIQSIETQLDETLEKMGIAVDKTEAAKTSQAKTQSGASQDDIDALFD